jgi:hypothetical protein
VTHFGYWDCGTIILAVRAGPLSGNQARMGMVRRTLIVLGMAAVVLTLAFVALFGVGGGVNASNTGSFPTLPTTTTTTSRPITTTSIAFLNVQGTEKRLVIHNVAVPNVVGMTLARADPELSVIGLSSGISSFATQPSGSSPTGTIVAQTPGPGLQVPIGTVIQLTVSGY